MLYRKYIAPNCIYLQQGQRSSGKLQEICDRLRTGQQTVRDLNTLTMQRERFEDLQTEFGIHYENEACSLHNWQDLWSKCKASTLPRRMYICKASYLTTKDNDRIVAALSALPPTKFQFATDVLCLAEGCDVRLIKNVNVAAGLVNSANGRVVKVLYNNADVSELRKEKYPPPHCIIVEFQGFQGFLTPTQEDPKHRVFPFPSNQRWVPIYRENFIPVRRDLSTDIVKKQSTSQCYRQQFPLDLSAHITAHRAQGQTLSGCNVSVDLGLDDSSKHVPSDIAAILYVAITRVTKLENLFLAPIQERIWTEIGQSSGNHECRLTDMDLKDAALEFAKKHRFHKEMDEELKWEPNYENADMEFEELKKQKNPPEVNEKPNFEPIHDTDMVAQCASDKFQFAFKPANKERYIGLDQGTHNFGITVVDTFLNEPPQVLAAENFDLDLPKRVKAADVLLKLSQLTPLFNWMQQTEERLLPETDRVIVLIEQMSILNTNAKQFGIQLGKLLQRTVKDVNTCIVKLSQPHNHGSNGPIFKLGRMIVEELKLTPIEIGNKRARPSLKEVQPLAAPTTLDDQSQFAFEDESDSDAVPHMESLSISSPKNPNSRKSRRIDDDVEPSDDEMDTSDGPTVDRNVLEVVDASHGSEYSKKKKMSAAIFRYFMHADETKQQDMGIIVDRHLQETWQPIIDAVKLDDVGDALLHSLKAILCGGVMLQTIGTVQLGIALQSYGGNICSARLHLLDRSPLHLEHSRAGKTLECILHRCLA